MYVERNIEARSRKHCCHVKTARITYSKRVCILAVSTQHASLYFNLWHVCLHHIFSTLSQKGHDFRKNLLNAKCAFWYYLQLLLKIFLILRIIQLDIFIIVKMSSCKVPLILVWLQWNLNFLYRFSRKKLPSFKYCQYPSSASRFITCGRTDGQIWRS